MMPEEIEILYRDENYIAVNKPAGLAVHRSRMTRDQRRFLVPVVRDMVGRHVYPVHRLDRPTGGVILLAFDSEATRMMSERFVAGEVSKTYLAVVRGYTAKDARIDHPLTKSTDEIGRKKEKKIRGHRFPAAGNRRVAFCGWPLPDRALFFCEGIPAHRSAASDKATFESYISSDRWRPKIW